MNEILKYEINRDRENLTTIISFEDTKPNTVYVHDGYIAWQDLSSSDVTYVYTAYDAVDVTGATILKMADVLELAQKNNEPRLEDSLSTIPVPYLTGPSKSYTIDELTELKTLLG